MTVALHHRSTSLPSGDVVHIWSPARQPTGLVQLQHGFAEYAERYVDEYRRLVPELVARGHEVWALDLQGHGRSPGRRAVTDIRHAVTEHRAVRRTMLARGLPVVAFGHSLGGLVTAASVAGEPAGVERVVLTSPVILNRTALPLRLLARGVAAIAPAANLPGRPARMAHDPEVARRASIDPLVYPGTTTLRVGSTALDVADELWRRLHKWRTPTTVFHGTLDEATSYERSAIFVGTIGRPDVRLRTVNGGFHELLHDRPGDTSLLTEVLAAIEQD